MADELDERLTDEEPVTTLWSDEVAESKYGVKEADENTGEELPCPVAPPPARKFIVPPGCQKLLAVWLSYKLRDIIKKKKKKKKFCLLDPQKLLKTTSLICAMRAERNSGGT